MSLRFAAVVAGGLALFVAIDNAQRAASLDAFHAWSATPESEELLTCLVRPMSAHIAGESDPGCDSDRFSELSRMQEEALDVDMFDILAHL